MRKLRYNELDEMAWEAAHGCYDGPAGDECWDEVCAREIEPPEIHTRMPVEDGDDEPDETGPGIFGSELNHEQNANGGGNPCISNGKLFGHGEKDEIIRMIFDNLMPFKDYHFEFGFFEAK